VIHLIRHGATDQPMLRPPGDLTPATFDEWRQDFGLNGRGRSEADALRLWLDRMERPDRLLSSPKRRTRETAALAAPGLALELTDDLHEWHGDEPTSTLLARVRRLLERGEDEALWCFTHGGFIRAVLAALIVGAEETAFETTFHGLRRSLHVWNASLTFIGHGPAGLEIVSVNQSPAIDALLQK
jgi:broad specificity phosphatase PhoE